MAFDAILGWSEPTNGSEGGGFSLLLTRRWGCPRGLCCSLLLVVGADGVLLLGRVMAFGMPVGGLLCVYTAVLVEELDVVEVLFRPLS